MLHGEDREVAGVSLWDTAFDHGEELRLVGGEEDLSNAICGAEAGERARDGQAAKRVEGAKALGSELGAGHTSAGAVVADAGEVVLQGDVNSDGLVTVRRLRVAKGNEVGGIPWVNAEH